MSQFAILNHLDKLQPDGGSNDPQGDHSFHCPVCGADNFKVNVRNGKWGTYSCNCASTESGKRRIRDALSPAAQPRRSSIKPRRIKQERHWAYYTAESLKSGTPAITVNRWDDPDQPDGNGWKNGRLITQSQQLDKGIMSYQEVAAQVQPYRLHDALKARENGAPYIFWAEGEPCCDALWNLGLPAITSIGGSGNFKLERDGPRATGIPAESLVVVPDQDQPGIKYAQEVAAAYPGCKWLCPFPGTHEWDGSCPKHGGLDIADWITQGATVEGILAGIEPQFAQPAAEPWSNAQTAPCKPDSLDAWDELLANLVNPKHPLFERNIVRRQIRAATAAAEAGLRVSSQQVRSRLIAKQRELISGTTIKGTAGGQKVKAPAKEWLISGLIPMRCLTAIAAFAKVGKTKFLCSIAASLIYQQPLMGNPEWQPSPGPHKIILWLTDQPAADSNGYLQAVGLQALDGTLHPSIIKLYTEEDDLAWDDQGIDQLLEDITANPGAVLITDSFFANVQRPYGSDQDPEAGGALIDTQTLLSQSGTTHLCAFHSPKEPGLTGVNAIRGHSSAAGVPSVVISLHFLERKDPSGNAKWVMDKENPYRRMVVEGRAPYRDLLVQLNGAAGVWSCHGDYSTGIAQLAQGQQVDELPSLTKNQREVLDVIGRKQGLTVKQIAYEWKQCEPRKSDIELCRKTVSALIRKQLVSERPSNGGNSYHIRKSQLTTGSRTGVDMAGALSETRFSQLPGMVGGELERLVLDQKDATITNHSNQFPTLACTSKKPCGDSVPTDSTLSEDFVSYARDPALRGSAWDVDDGDDPYWPPRPVAE